MERLVTVAGLLLAVIGGLWGVYTAVIDRIESAEERLTAGLNQLRLEMKEDNAEIVDRRRAEVDRLSEQVDDLEQRVNMGRDQVVANTTRLRERGRLLDRLFDREFTIEEGEK